VKPKPAALKILMGNPGKRPIVPEIQPVRDLELDDMPDWLPPEAQQVWREELPKIPRGILGLHHAEAFANWCDLTVQRRRSVREVHAAGKEEFFERLPRYTNLVDAWRKMSAELGLTPVSTPKAPPKTGADASNPFVALKRTAT